MVSFALGVRTGLDAGWVWSLSAHGVSATRLQAFHFPTLETDLERKLTTPWAYVAQNRDGRIRGYASTHFRGGLFWSVSEGRLLVSDTLKSVVRSRHESTDLDEGFITGVATRSRRIPPSSTPFQHVRTLTPGSRLEWDPGSTSPDVIRLVGSEEWTAPHIRGKSTLDLYRRTFDAAVDSLVVPGQPICATLSGGLDSTFVVASLARHATADKPIHAYCHSPHPDAVCATKNNWDPDDYPWAQEMAKAYPERIVLHRLVTDVGDNPLDAAARQSETSWFPTLTPANHMWLHQASERAANQGGTRLFIGRNGNAAFSYSHDYAFGYYVRKAELLSAWRSIHTSEPMLEPDRDKIRARVLSPLASHLRTRLRRERSAYLPLVGLDHVGAVDAPAANRKYYLDWLAGAPHPPAAAMFKAWPTPLVDPFCDPTLLRLAAAMTPLEWSKGPQPRGYARLLGQGRVPDSITLRTRQGGQSMDQWYFMRNHRDRYYDEASLLAQTPILGGWVDHTALLRRLDTWPWGQREGPPLLPLLAMNSILSLGAYVRMMTENLQHLPHGTR